MISRKKLAAAALCLALAATGGWAQSVADARSTAADMEFARSGSPPDLAVAAERLIHTAVTDDETLTWIAAALQTAEAANNQSAANRIRLVQTIVQERRIVEYLTTTDATAATTDDRLPPEEIARRRRAVTNREVGDTVGLTIGVIGFGTATVFHLMAAQLFAARGADWETSADYATWTTYRNIAFGSGIAGAIGVGLVVPIGQLINVTPPVPLGY